MRKTNQAGISIIKDFEGFRAKAYVCPAGRLTVGYGHTRGVNPGDEVSPDVAEQYLMSDLAYAEQVVETSIHVPITDNQFSALVSFVFNVGVVNFIKSTLLRVLNQGKYKEAADEFLKWNKAAGRVLPGLVKRRAAEQALFTTQE